MWCVIYYKYNIIQERYSAPIIPNCVSVCVCLFVNNRVPFQVILCTRPNKTQTQTMLSIINLISIILLLIVYIRDCYIMIIITNSFFVGCHIKHCMYTGKVHSRVYNIILTILYMRLLPAGWIPFRVFSINIISYKSNKTYVSITCTVYGKYITFPENGACA